ncbi:MAG: hypothetical protein ABIG44_09210 [Planctomycetota bacterium]
MQRHLSRHFVGMLGILILLAPTWAADEPGALLLNSNAQPIRTFPPPEGENCQAPIIVDLPVFPCYFDWNYTCGRINHYDDTCLGNYDDGEEIIYQLNVDNPMAVDIRLEPLGTSWTGMAIDDTCPPDGDCLATSTNSSADPHAMSVWLEEGTYFLMIDTWPSPDCIPFYYLTITEILPCAVYCPEDASHEDEPDCGLNYVDNFNGGCGSNPTVFSPISCGETICGKSGVFPAGSPPDNYYNMRDTDWYQVELTEPTYLTMTAEAAFPALFGVVNTGGIPDCWLADGLFVYDFATCYTPTSLSTLLTPGTWWLWIAPDTWDCIPCGSEYVISLDCLPVSTAVCCHGYKCFEVDPLDLNDPHNELQCLAEGGTFLINVDCNSFPCDCGGSDYRGDADCLGNGPNSYDIDHFIEAIGAGPAWMNTHNCNYYCANDINCDGLVDAYDIDGFIVCISAGMCEACP